MCSDPPSQRLDGTLRHQSSWWCHPPPDKKATSWVAGKRRPAGSPQLRHFVVLREVCIAHIGETVIQEPTRQWISRSVNGPRNHNFLQFCSRSAPISTALLLDLRKEFFVPWALLLFPWMHEINFRMKLPNWQRIQRARDVSNLFTKTYAPTARLPPLRDFSQCQRDPYDSRTPARKTQGKREQQFRQELQENHANPSRSTHIPTSIPHPSQVFEPK